MPSGSPNDPIDRVLASLRAFASAIGLNHFWLEWDQAGHFNLEDADDTISDVALSGWSAGSGRWLASAFYALPQTVRQRREVRLLASTLDEVAQETFWASLATARTQRTTLARRVPPASLRLFDGTTDIAVTYEKKLKPVLQADEPTTTELKKPPTTLWGYSLTETGSHAVTDRLYEELLAELGAPTHITRFEPIGYFFPTWVEARLSATVHPVGCAVVLLNTAHTKLG